MERAGSIEYAVQTARMRLRSFTIESTQQPNNFDFLRLMLALLVLYSHCYPLGTGSEIAEPVRRLTHGQMTGGAVAVDLFFVMSGFLITASADRSRSLHSFFRKRAARVYPAFLLATLVALLFVLPLSGGSLQPEGAAHRAADVLLQSARLREFNYAGAFTGNPFPSAINGSLWSIQYEFWCYVGVAILLLAGVLRQRFVVLSLFCVSLAVSTLFVVRGWVFGGKWLGVLLGSPQLWARLLPLYLAGVVVYLWRDRVRFSLAGASLACVVLALAAWCPWGCAALFPLAGTYLVFWFAFSPAIRLHRVGRFGDFSYGAYLYAFPVQQLLMKAFSRAVSPWVLFVCAAPLTLLAAVASWHAVERRFLRSTHRGAAPSL